MLAYLSLSMSKLLMSVLGNYNRRLRATFIYAEQQWLSLCSVEDDLLSEDELEKRREALLLAMAYLEQPQHLAVAVYNMVNNSGPLNDSANRPRFATG